jgi:hypothetical protein
LDEFPVSLVGRFVFPAEMKIDKTRSTITLTERDESTEPTPRTKRQGLSRDRHHIAIPADGRFEFHQLEPGTYDLTVHLSLADRATGLWSFQSPPITPDMFPSKSAPPVIDLGDIRVPKQPE